MPLLRKQLNTRQLSTYRVPNTKKATDSLRGWVALFTIVVSLLYTDSTGNSDLSLDLCFGCCKGGHADGHYNEGCGSCDNKFFHGEAPS